MADTTSIGSQQAISLAYTAPVKSPASEAPQSGSSIDPAAASSQSDSTSISSTSTLLSQALSGSDDVRTGKVAALQQSIAAGTYNVSSADVASKIVDALLS